MFLSFFQPKNDFLRQMLVNSNLYLGNFWSLGLDRFEKRPKLRPQRPIYSTWYTLFFAIFDDFMALRPPTQAFMVMAQHKMLEV